MPDAKLGFSSATISSIFFCATCEFAALSIVFQWLAKNCVSCKCEALKKKIRRRFPFRDHLCVCWRLERPRPRPRPWTRPRTRHSSIYIYLFTARERFAANLLIMQFNASTAQKLQHQQKKSKKKVNKEEKKNEQLWLWFQILAHSMWIAVGNSFSTLCQQHIQIQIRIQIRVRFRSCYFVFFSIYLHTRYLGQIPQRCATDPIPAALQVGQLCCDCNQLWHAANATHYKLLYFDLLQKSG